ncbi:TolC family outer membrane protein [Sphingomonas sp.]|jgi:outer membrane protein|uniref:TolC family outer membrane protein n=1 Tax=Sphingomonas sp. TaxID=28214 RepID=UPI002D810603|nr:TolC family outer membrane protein [Sphingomonas sp.]HEU0045028.1 TolC family outer membrane protein [Sphingomonas sp.]
MLRSATRLLLGGALISAAPAYADTLREALLRAYQTNPTITGARAAQRASDEDVPIARAAGLPSVNAGTDFNENLLRGGNSFSSPARSASASTNLVVPLYRGGAVRNSVRAAETRSEAGRANLRGTEASLFTDVVAAYNDVIRDEAIVGLNQQNVRVLEVNLRASRDRFQVGDLTRTDVAQSEARLSIARAQLQSAAAQLIASRETYIRLVGDPPGELAPPPTLPNLPASTDAAVATALADNPFLIAAARQRDATRFDVGVARAARLPQVNGVVGGSYQNFLGSLGAGTSTNVGQSGTAGSLGLSLNLPLFQGGRPAAQIRQAEARRGQAIEAVTETERGVVAQTRSAFALYRSSLEVIASSETAVRANRLSLEGVRAENSVGTRTILDILNAEQELLNSQVNLVSARRNAYVAGFNLLAAMGRAEARDLGLEGGPLYDPLVNYNRVRRKINDWDSDGEPAPVATPTATTPAQDATVTRPLDPLLDTPVDRNPGLSTGSVTPVRR